ncbi:RNA polymerase sigma factor [Qipengyuania algicida]|uniref:RNA polymerase sigma factor n=1 Tax=Qipengyuania algicida TaxID=1836209 RepID=UPI00301B8117
MHTDDDGTSTRGGLTVLLNEHRPELVRFLTARCGNSNEAEDLFQELWLKAATTVTGPIANGRAYLFRMAHHLVLDRVRERTRRMRRERIWLDDGAYAPTESVHSDPSPSAENALLVEEEVEVLRDAIAQLPPGARRALVLYRFEGHSQANIASLMGISRSGVEKHIAAAMRHLRDALANSGYFDGAASKEVDGREARTPSDGKDR